MTYTIAQLLQHGRVFFFQSTMKMTRDHSIARIQNCPSVEGSEFFFKIK
jgi:hypothetical protein